MTVVAWVLLDVLLLALLVRQLRRRGPGDAWARYSAEGRTRRSWLILAILLLGCTDATMPVPECPAPPPRPTTIAVTAGVFGLWLVSTDNLATRTIYGIGGPPPLDTARVAADSTTIVGYLLNARGVPLCHDTRRALPGDVVSLACQP